MFIHKTYKKLFLREVSWISVLWKMQDNPVFQSNAFLLLCVRRDLIMRSLYNLSENTYCNFFSYLNKVVLHLSTWEKDRSHSGGFVFVSMFKWKGKEKIHRWQAWKGNSSFSLRSAPIPTIFIYNFQKPERREPAGVLPGEGSHHKGDYKNKATRRK